MKDKKKKRNEKLLEKREKCLAKIQRILYREKRNILRNIFSSELKNFKRKEKCIPKKNNELAINEGTGHKWRKKVEKIKYIIETERYQITAMTYIK